MKKIGLLIGVLTAPAWASTEPHQYFIGAKGGYQWPQDDSYEHSNPNGAIFGVYGGVQYSPAWSWDIGYQYHNDLKAETTTIKTWLIESALRYDWYLQDNVSLYGRLGGALWDMDKKNRFSDNLSAVGFSPLGEIGVNYTFSPNFRLSAGYQYIDSIGKSKTGKYDSHAAL
ncbi:outer membrane beta-barrel protein, partial [uncultured Vibrio sp.]|uniref:outer membrane beta-barrel protein n=1 Tax=uncultured Vibrio sp. TaxID=114054 RepID=UPI0026080676